MGELYGDGPSWRERSGWTLLGEMRRWAKCILSVIPGGLGSELRRRFYGFRSVGRDVFLGEGFWVEYPDRLTIGEHVAINQNCRINAGGTVSIEDWVLIGPGVTIYSQNHDVSRIDVPIALADDVRKPVNIGEGAWLGANSTVLPGVSIGPGAVVGAGAVVTKDVPALAIVAGVPAGVISIRGAGNES